MFRAEWVPILAVGLGCCSCTGPETPASPGKPRTAERETERARLADHLARRGIRDRRVLQAIRDVPRHWFVPATVAALAYDDDALPIGAGQTISQPYIVALMTEVLELKDGTRVLEIGTGSGYQAAVLSELAREVSTIEILPELAERARATFAEHGYSGVEVRLGDGWEGWPERAPFDAILVAAAPGRIPEKLFAQLAPGGRMCIPVGPDPSSQELLLVRKLADGSRSIERIAPVRFVPMTGGEEPPR
jgi:protein-L-isoaspartate(D-aspartate) O-methyltransferase